MPVNQQLDSAELVPLEFSYDRSLAELSETPRLIRGSNMYVTFGGKLAKRPGMLIVDNTGQAMRCDRLFMVETLETPPKLFILGSFYDLSTGRWKLYYNRLSGPSPGWVAAPSLRSLQNSIAPHEVGVSRGLAYIRAIPDPVSSDKYGTAVFDGSGASPTFKLWGLPAPTVPAAITGRVTRLSSGIDNITTTINVVADFAPPVTPNFVIQVDYEQMLVTSTGAGTNWTVTRGYNGTTADAHGDNTIVLYRDWSASDHRVKVEIGWRYTYAWKSSTGQISCRAPLEVNPDLMPSATGPFENLIPKYTVMGNSDTTNITHIQIYRSTDGGGTYYFLREIVNTGGSLITLEDKYLGTGPGSATFNDPIPDAMLDSGNIAPSLIDHLPPPTVLSPGVLGVDNPQRGTPIATYVARLWYAIGNVLFYSANEEVLEGIPEESWPGGTLGNLFRLPYQINNIAATTNALYIFTSQNTYVLTGNNRETFNVRQLYDAIGAPYGHPRAVCRFMEKMVFLTQDFRIALAENDEEPTILSDPLFTDLIDQLNLDSANMEIDIKYWSDLDKEWIIVAVHNKANAIYSKQWVMDLKRFKRTRRPFWFVPWTLRSTCLYTERLYEGNSQRRLSIWNWAADTIYGRIARMDPTGRTPTDQRVVNSAVTSTFGIDYFFDTHLHIVPPGNHVNTLRNPALTPVVQYFTIERTLTPGDEDPEFFGYFDDFWSNPIDLPDVEDPTRREQSIAYKTMQIHVNRVAYRFAFRAGLANSSSIQEFQGYSVTWNPDGGA